MWNYIFKEITPSEVQDESNPQPGPEPEIDVVGIDVSFLPFLYLVKARAVIKIWPSCERSFGLYHYVIHDLQVDYTTVTKV